ncbi:MAG TPA: phosphate ABC transporter substrate-binding protein PstS [Peptococcaceae bacterium]|nr:MAG: Phosphate-binding protein [Moorella sp. 60_41]HBT46600.1 phosphate ABC transporter substrate-binding protein PstS [Peptococcaceae bacterium]
MESGKPGRSIARRVTGILGVLVGGILLAAVACAPWGEERRIEPGGKPPVHLLGVGASFPYPLYSKWIEEYRKFNPHVNIDYQSIGSSGGINNILRGTVDFAGSDAPMTDEQLARAPAPIFHLPSVAGAVAITYNLPGVDKDLKLTPQVLADIFLGNITEWRDPELTSLNPELDLPDMGITVVRRSDGSGTTKIFTEYLSKVSPVWAERVGTGTSVEWPTGIGGKGNEGVAGTIKQIPGSIGYVEMAYATQNGLPRALIQNRAGRFVGPTLETTTAAAAGAAVQMLEDMRVSLTDAPGEDSYPIAGYTYLLVYRDQHNQRRGEALAHFLWWALHDGQEHARELLYAPLPDNVVKMAEAKIKEINYKGQPFIE